MDHKRLAFDLLKTVVSAQDEGREPTARIATTWALVRAELPPAHRVISDEVAWRRDQQSDLKFVIDALADRFRAEPELAAEVSALLELERAATTLAEPVEEVARAAEATSPEAEGPKFSIAPSSPVSVPTTAPDGDPPAESGDPSPTAGWLPEASQRAKPGLSLGLTTGQPATQRRSKPAALSPGARNRLVAAVLAVASGLLLTAVYVRWAAEPARAGTAVPSVVNVPAEARARQTTPIRERLPVRRAAPRSVADDVRAAREAQLLEVERLDAASAPPAQRSEAYAVLASLSADRGLYREAVEAQRVGLELAYDAGIDDALRMSRNHLALGRYYHHAGQSVIARAHLRQASHLAGQLGESPLAEEIDAEVRRLDPVAHEAD